MDRETADHQTNTMFCFKTAAKIIADRNSTGILEMNPRNLALLRQMRKLSESKSRYSKETELVLEKQDRELKLLEREKRHYKAELMTQEKEQAEDERAAHALQRKLAEVDSLEQQKRQAKEELADTRLQLRQTERDIEECRKIRRTCRDAMDHAAKRVTTAENAEKELEVETRHYDACLTELTNLREEVQHLHVTRDKLMRELHENEDAIKSLTYAIHKEIRYASESLDSYLKLRDSQTLLRQTLAKTREKFHNDVERIKRTMSLEKSQRDFVETKNKPLHSADHREMKRLFSYGASNKQTITEYADAIRDLSLAFADVLHPQNEITSPSKSGDQEAARPGQTSEAKEETRKGAKEGEVKQPGSAEKGERSERTGEVGRRLSVEVMRHRTAAQVIRERLGDNGLQTILASFLQLLRENQRLYWGVYHTSELANQLQQDNDDVREHIRDLRSGWERTAKIARTLRNQFADSIQARKRVAERTEEKLKKCDDVIRSYAVPLCALMKKMGITDEQLRQLTAPYHVVDGKTILRCMGAVENAVSRLQRQETLAEFEEFQPLLQDAREDGLTPECMPVPEARPPRFVLTDTFVVVPPALSDEEEDFEEVLCGVEEPTPILSTIPLPPDWEDRPLSRKEMTAHLERHLDCDVDTPRVVKLDNSLRIV